MDIKYKETFEKNKKLLLDRISKELGIENPTHEVITGWETWEKKIKVIAKANGKKCKITLNFNDEIEKEQMQFCFLATDKNGNSLPLEEIYEEFKEYVA